MSRGVVKWLSLFVCGVSSGASFASDIDSLWSLQGQPLHLNKRDHSTGVWRAPGDRASLIYGDDGSAVLKIGTFKTDVADMASYAASIEVSWSPEAQGVFVNASEGGAVGTWSSRVFVTRGDKVVEIPVRKNVDNRRVILTIPCGGDEKDALNGNRCVNFASLAWIDHGRKLLVVQMVPNSGGYPNMNEASLFLIDLQTANVEKVISPKEALASYRQYLAPWIREVLTYDVNQRPHWNADLPTPPSPKQ
jgi:hypothetical protein